MSKHGNSGLTDAFDPERFREQGHILVDRLADYLRDVKNGSGPVGTSTAPASPSPMMRTARRME